MCIFPDLVWLSQSSRFNIFRKKKVFSADIARQYCVRRYASILLEAKRRLLEGLIIDMRRNIVKKRKYRS